MGAVGGRIGSRRVGGVGVARPLLAAPQFLFLAGLPVELFLTLLELVVRLSRHDARTSGRIGRPASSCLAGLERIVDDARQALADASLNLRVSGA
jgi:hypothetical protein